MNIPRAPLRIESSFAIPYRGPSMGENKTKPTTLNATAFIAGLTDETKRADARALASFLGVPLWDPVTLDLEKPPELAHQAGTATSSEACSESTRL